MYYIMTAHKRFVAQAQGAGLIQVTYSKEIQPKLVVLKGEDHIQSGPMSAFQIIHAENGVQFRKNGKFLCADPSSAEILPNRDVAAQWETFFLVPEDQLPSIVDAYKSSVEEFSRFSRAITELIKQQQPIKIHCGCGPTPRSGFLNIDITMMAPTFAINHPDQYFIFPFVDMSWDIPDDCIDYVFHEDFIEHITQLQQIQFLAETLRVLKPGCYHRVNTPNLITAMKRHSKFKDGFNGVYTGELQWGHISIFSPASLKEIAELVGYREVIFTTKHHGVSPYAEPDDRPWSDRDEITGNIYADLLK